MTIAAIEPDALSTELISILVSDGVLDDAAIERANRARARSGDALGLVLTRLGLVSEQVLASAYARLLDAPRLTSADLPSAPVEGAELRRDFLTATAVLPVRLAEGAVLLAMADPLNDEAAEAVSYYLGVPVIRAVATRTDIEHALARYGSETDTLDQTAPGDEAEIALADIERLEDLASGAPVIRLVKQLIEEAVAARASDIHIEPTEDSVRVRYRIDGALHDAARLDADLHAALTSRIKIMARLNIAERRLPQDGRARTSVRGEELDLRISTAPTLLGESVVLRLLDKSGVDMNFAALGFSPEAQAGLESLLAEPNGVFLVTGPTGSGKTTTLYAALIAINDPQRKIFSIEDPVEYRIDGVNQMQVNAKINLSFASALRSLLRQDPDVMMVGEIRDRETAEIAAQAALTGHLVLSTVHTNSAASTITRLMDMGLEDYLVASTVTGVAAQRLVRKLCPACVRSAPAPAELFARIGISAPAGATIGVPQGCNACGGTGFSGRTVIAELMLVTPAIRSLILRRASEEEIEAAAVQNGMTPMLADGAAKALAGVTTIEDVLRAARMK